MTAVSRKSIAATYQKIKRYVRKTPVIEIAAPGIEAPVTLKLEMLQHSGSFKARGAFASLLGAELPAAGVAAASGGNHGAAVAYAAQQLGIPAHIFVPSSAPMAKIAKIRGYGAMVVSKGGKYVEALQLCEQYIADSGAMPIHAYDAVGTLTGQGTVALELEDQAPDLDTVLVAVGGGGLIGGIAAWCEGGMSVVAVESEGCPTLHVSLRGGRREMISPQGLAADSLGASSPGELMFPIAQRVVGASVLVSDAAIADAQRWLWHNMRLVTEPGGATAFAALLSGRYVPDPGERAGVVVCGANADLDRFVKTVQLPPV
jgi:threonine dehydratase